MTAVRVGVIGARRARHGLGPFVARELRAAGAEVPCFLSTSEATRDAAAAELVRTACLRAQGYLDLDAMLAAERLDALAILSPHETHQAYLEAALAAGLHALCEKPLVWGVDDLGEAAARLAAAFDARGLALWENCQWPYAVPALERLHPGALDRPPGRFAMLLQPAAHSANMLADSLPHVLSLLQTLAPGSGPSLADVRFSTADPEAQAVVVGFLYHAGGVTVQTEIELRPTDKHPRDVAIEIDGRRARRLVSARDYRLSFHGDGRTVVVEDPLALLVTDFVRELERGAGKHSRARSREIVERMRLLGELATAYERAAA